MISGIEGGLGSPPKAFMPTPETVPIRKRPLIILAENSVERARKAQEEGRFDPMAQVLAEDPNAPETWNLDRLPKVLVIGRVDYDHELFAASPRHPWKPNPDTLRSLLRPTLMRQDRRSAVTIGGELVEMDYTGIIFTDFLKRTSEDPDEPSELLTLARNLREKTAPPQHLTPEIFTFGSMFNPALQDFPELDSSQKLLGIDPRERADFLDELVVSGLGALEREAGGKHIRLTAKRALDMSEKGLLAIGSTINIYPFLSGHLRLPQERVTEFAPTPHSPVYVPNIFDDTRLRGSIILPLQWIDKVVDPKTRVAALAHLLRATSFARDDYYSLLRGTRAVAVPGIGASEVPHMYAARKRADSLMGEVIREARAWDEKIFKLPIRLDPNADYAEKTGYNPYLYYDDPPDRNDRRRGPGWNDPDDDGSGSFPKTPSPALTA